MLRMSKMADYGTVVMTCMARDPEKVYSAGAVAEEIGVAQPTVRKILKMLARKELVISQRGAKGGYTLSRSPAQISVAQIIHAMDGPIALTECSVSSGVCEQEDDCTVRTNWQKINHIIRRALEGVTLAEMARPAEQHYVVPVASIRRSKKVYS